VRLAGMAAAVPQLKECTWEDTGFDAEQCELGMEQNLTPVRRSAEWEQCQSDFCVAAAERLMADLGWSPEQIDVVVMTTLTADYPIPATAIIVQDRLGIPKSALAFDLPVGGHGFLHGLQVVASMLSAGFLKRGLLLSGAVAKAPAKRGASTLEAVHGHCGTVCALEYCQGSPAMSFDSGGDGSTFEAFYMPVGGVRMPPRPEMFVDPDAAARACGFRLDSKKIGQLAQRELPLSVRRVMAHCGKAVSDFDGFYFNPLPMQDEANLRTELGIPFDRFHSEIREFGDGASGSAVLAMLARGASRLQSGCATSLIAGIGPGLAWGSAALPTENLVCSPILEV
jgi:3-oxoacyl-[acyl-carrier-protein] synthase III